MEFRELVYPLLSASLIYKTQRAVFSLTMSLRFFFGFNLC